MKYTEEEEKWLRSFRRVMKKAPESLRSKVSSYATGDACITLFDLEKYEAAIALHAVCEDYDIPHDVEMSDGHLEIIDFPFSVEATCG